MSPPPRSPSDYLNQSSCPSLPPSLALILQPQVLSADLTTLPGLTSEGAVAVVQTTEQGGLEKGVELSNTERHGLHQHLWQHLSTGSLHDGRAEGPEACVELSEPTAHDPRPAPALPSGKLSPRLGYASADDRTLHGPSWLSLPPRPTEPWRSWGNVAEG